MKKWILFFALIAGYSGLRAQQNEFPPLQKDFEKSMEEMMRSLENAFGEGNFLKMDTTFFKSFSFPLEGQMMPIDSSFFRSFSFPFGEEMMPFNQGDLQGMEKMLQELLNNWLGPDQMKEWGKKWKEEQKEVKPGEKTKKRKTTIL